MENAIQRVVEAYDHAEKEYQENGTPFPKWLEIYHKSIDGLRKLALEETYPSEWGYDSPRRAGASQNKESVFDMINSQIQNLPHDSNYANAVSKLMSLRRAVHSTDIDRFDPNRQQPE